MAIRSLPSSSGCSNSSSSSSYSLASTSLSNRLETIFRKASELCTLCDIEACVIYYGPDGELKTWPPEREKVEDIALRYSQLNEALRRKKSVTLYDFLNKKKNKTNLEKKAKIKDNDLKRLSLEPHVSKVRERIRFVESQKHKETKPDHQSLASSSLNNQTQSLNPSQFSLFMYNHGDNILSQIPVSASNFNQDYFSALLEQSELKSQIMKQEVCGYEQNMCMSNNGDATLSQIPLSASNFNQEFSALLQEESGLMQQELCNYDQNMFMNNNNFQHSFVSNTQDHSAPAVQESVNNNYGLMPHVPCGYDQNLFTSDITNNNLLIDNSMFL
ncbi:unnamed protein product [Arabidopsis thaliana]|uniref:AGAMOUS-like 98 n=2 Tax=Arabidopsis thaliana TaxID=3702 RepID=Q9FIW6_ARATH|nr:AGAMOUS-like 98 [Arabidopsis thaliana]AED94478.1 AGAMOUS-like 98 [Arabidopsis thaliana]BAB11385.1 unnamed protein product [Arabidopsis thaliana]VYS68761.1 unnamed protein product [Arabidopsis thaliana]|eukprot:NP_198797.1 AGAMOUS-like 98 [Arabidopsis thaliana]